MIDLHSHILPGIDDGAKTVEDAVEILREQKRQGVKSVVFTPHYNFERKSIEAFSKTREESYQKLKRTREFLDLMMSVRLGAEVYYSIKLMEEDIRPLCFEGTNYILIELPTNEKPFGMMHTLTAVINRGYIPILAHIERYPYFEEDPLELYELVSRGCLAQVNAGPVASKVPIVMKYLKWELAQVISSDCHSMGRRRPNLKDGMAAVEQKLGEQYRIWLEKNSRNIYNGKYIDIPVVKKPKKIFGTWR